MADNSPSPEREKPTITISWAFLGIGHLSGTDLLEVATYETALELRFFAWRCRLKVSRNAII